MLASAAIETPARKLNDCVSWNKFVFIKKKSSNHITGLFTFLFIERSALMLTHTDMILGVMIVFWFNLTKLFLS